MRAGTGPGTGPTRREAAGPGWRRSSRGLYVAASVDLSPEQRIVEAAALVPRFGAITGWAALRWHGARWFGGTAPDGAHLPVPIALSRGSIRPQPGVRLCEERFDLRETAVVDGVRTTSPVRSLLFAMRYARSVREAVVAADMAAYADLVSLEELGQHVDDHPSWTGIQQARDAVVLADENSWSPMETATRCSWELDALRPRPLTNRPIFRDGVRVATPDLVDPEAGVVVEYDGAVHRGEAARLVDAERDELYEATGLTCVRVAEGDIADLSRFVAQLHRAYARQARRTSDRTWTLAAPVWWQHTHTVDLRRALTDQDRATWLRYRTA